MSGIQPDGVRQGPGSQSVSPKNGSSVKWTPIETDDVDGIEDTRTSSKKLTAITITDDEKEEITFTEIEPERAIEKQGVEVAAEVAEAHETLLKEESGNSKNNDAIAVEQVDIRDGEVARKSDKSELRKRATNGSIKADRKSSKIESKPVPGRDLNKYAGEPGIADPVPLESVEIGKEYEYQDKHGNWFPITITGYDDEKALYSADVHDGSKSKLTKVLPSQCVPAANPEVFIWWKYLLWMLLDASIMAGVVCAIYFNYKHLQKVNGDYWGLIVPCSFPVYILFRLFHWLVFPQRAGCTSVPPFVCRKVEQDGKEVYFVGTMHVSPGSVGDVIKVMDEINPDVVMIELDYERLEGMKEEKDPKPVAQRLFVNPDGKKVVGVHADWNARMNKQEFKGQIELQDDGKKDLTDKVLTVPYNGGNDLLGRVRSAAERNASALFFLDPGKMYEGEERFSTPMMKSGGFRRLAYCFCHCKKEPAQVPTYLVPYTQITENHQDAEVACTVKSSSVPVPHTCGRIACRTIVMMLSGIGILYGIIRLAGVEVGGEFIVSDKLARERKKPLVTIDMSIGRLGRRICQQIIPWPSNIWYCFTAWLSFPRIALSWVFLPMLHKVDLILNMAWGFARFRLRTWLAFLLGLILSTALIMGIVMGITHGAKAAGEAAAHNQSEEKRDNIAKWIGIAIPLVIKIWFYPAVYKALLDSRDEQMYRGTVAQIRNRPNAKKFLVVIGAAHSNGMIRRCYERGF